MCAQGFPNTFDIIIRDSRLLYIVLSLIPDYGSNDYIPRPYHIFRHALIFLAMSLICPLRVPVQSAFGRSTDTLALR